MPKDTSLTNTCITRSIFSIDLIFFLHFCVNYPQMWPKWKHINQCWSLCVCVHWPSATGRPLWEWWSRVLDALPAQHTPHRWCAGRVCSRAIPPDRAPYISASPLSQSLFSLLQSGLDAHPVRRLPLLRSRTAGARSPAEARARGTAGVGDRCFVNVCLRGCCRRRSDRVHRPTPPAEARPVHTRRMCRPSAASPPHSGSRPSILLMHPWWGRTSRDDSECLGGT